MEYLGVHDKVYRDDGRTVMFVDVHLCTTAIEGVPRDDVRSYLKAWED